MRHPNIVPVIVNTPKSCQTSVESHSSSSTGCKGDVVIRLHKVRHHSCWFPAWWGDIIVHFNVNVVLTDPLKSESLVICGIFPEIHHVTGTNEGVTLCSGARGGDAAAQISASQTFSDRGPIKRHRADHLVLTIGSLQPHITNYSIIRWRPGNSASFINCPCCHVKGTLCRFCRFLHRLIFLHPN